MCKEITSLTDIFFCFVSMVGHGKYFPWINTTRFNDFSRLGNVDLTRLHKLD